MIKLIVSDMDGTLLDSQKRLPSDFFDVLDMLFERGIQFAIASGRTYSALEYMFPEEYRRRLYFICDNGACTVVGDKTDNVFSIERELYLRLLDECERIGGLTPIVCAESGVYHQRSDDDFFNEVGIYYKKHKVVDDLAEINEIVYKLAVSDEGTALVHGKAALDAKFNGRLNVLVSGINWMDVMSDGVSKGAALKVIQQKLGISKSETMAFGDYFNDVDMLLQAEENFCPENGHEDVKRLCRHIAPDCDHNGVTRCIKRFVLNLEN